MPIIDPISFCSFLNEIDGTKSKYSKHFFIRYLKIASQNLYRNSQTIDISFQFKEDLKTSFHLLNKLFGCNFIHGNDFDDPSINDFYHFLYNNIESKYKTHIFKIQKGSYHVLYNNFKIFYFKPFIDIPDNRSWFLTTSPVATLVIKERENFNSSVIQLSNLEIDLMAASGFSIVLCVKIRLKSGNYNKILNEMISNHKFAEIHFNIDIKEDEDEIEKIEDFYMSLLKVYDKIDGYFYLYSQFILNKESKTREIIKMLKQKPRFRYIFTSINVNETLKMFQSSRTKNFVYCKTGFDDDQLRMSLCNVPLYKTKEDEKDFLATEYSGTGIGYISKDDFLNYKDSRIKIIFCDPKKNNQHFVRFIDFNDIHFIKSDMYVNDTIYLAKTKENTLDTINNIRLKIDKFKKLKKFTFNKKKNDFRDFLFYASHELENFNSKFISNFKIHDNQLLTVIEACQSFLFSNKRKNKGVIYQVETGEGKSCIVQILAAVLALMNKTVHVVSSNISLSNRDYYDSYDYFKKLGLTSAVLLHYNELPYVDINNSVNANVFYSTDKFPKEFFNENLFMNTSRMNFSVCGVDADNNYTKNKANIIFSTIVNLECFYLKMTELCPSYIFNYFGKCCLLIDEADSILIDELTNGTILSRPIKTNAKDILPYVYESRINNVSPEIVCNHIHETWPECENLKPEDINFMYNDVDIACKNEFKDGLRYSIVEFKQKKQKSFVECFQKSLNDIRQKKAKFKKQVIHFIKDQFKKDKNKEKKHKEKSKDKSQKNKSNMVKMIIPFDYKHKGILEPNKEFGGFVQQFIAIKEMHHKEDNSNMIIKDITMNYLFVSHPIFVDLYYGVVGLTGTVGNKYDKELLKDQYNFTTMKIPRNNPNKRVELPILLCDNIDDRNQKIISEIIHFHEQENPVLVIFEDLNEISIVLYMLTLKGIKNVNIFDGTDDKIKPDRISGLKGAITLGTNVCGRGTDIKNPAKPLHVIVTYFTSNTRVIYQAFGRTARQGNEGSVRIICLKEQYILSIDILNGNDINSLIDDFRYKNKLQIEFIERIKKTRPWIFAGLIESQKLSHDDINTLRDTRINVNRINACNFVFPISMSIQTFLNIQAQKIFSLNNCPNCKYTWRLFRQYIREMILQAWSLFINQTERKYNNEKTMISFKQFVESEISHLYESLNIYLPESSGRICGIVETFMNIHKIIVNQYEYKILKIFPNKMSSFYMKNNSKKYISFRFGFEPYSLIDKSGAKINTIGDEEHEINYISDPELKYMRELPKRKLSLASITEKIDDIFDLICQKINDVIGSYIGLKLFLRRTLGGCEFGVCLDLDITMNNKFKMFDCLVDQDPLIKFTISLKSFTPFLAGILMCALVYIAYIAKTIADTIMSLGQNFMKNVIKKTVSELLSNIAATQIERISDSICSFLTKHVVKSLNEIKKIHSDMADVFINLLKIISPRDFSKTGDEIQHLFFGNVSCNIESNFEKKFVNNKLPWSKFAKIGFLLLMCLSSFLMAFHFKAALDVEEGKIAENYDKTQKIDSALRDSKKIIHIEEEKIDLK